MLNVTSGAAVGFGVGAAVGFVVGVIVPVGVGMGVAVGLEGVGLGVADGVGLPVLENVAVALWAASILTVQVVCVALQAPDQPSKREPFWTEAVNVTLDPAENLAESYGAIWPKLIPYGLDETVP